MASTSSRPSCPAIARGKAEAPLYLMLSDREGSRASKRRKNKDGMNQKTSRKANSAHELDLEGRVRQDEGGPCHVKEEEVERS